jgi:hypothetical protein
MLAVSIYNAYQIQHGDNFKSQLTEAVYKMC